MKIFITTTFKGDSNRDYIEKISRLVREAGFEDFSFIRDVEAYVSIPDAHELMRRAGEEISKCDALLLDYDGPGHGCMIELGIAYANKKKNIVITKKGTVIKKTILGVADTVIEYENIEDIMLPLSLFKARWN